MLDLVFPRLTADMSDRIAVTRLIEGLPRTLRSLALRFVPLSLMESAADDVTGERLARVIHTRLVRGFVGGTVRSATTNQSLRKHTPPSPPH